MSTSFTSFTCRWVECHSPTLQLPLQTISFKNAHDAHEKIWWIHELCFIYVGFVIIELSQLSALQTHNSHPLSLQHLGSAVGPTKHQPETKQCWASPHGWKVTSPPSKLLISSGTRSVIGILEVAYEQEKVWTHQFYGKLTALVDPNHPSSITKSHLWIPNICSVSFFQPLLGCLDESFELWDLSWV